MRQCHYCQLNSSLPVNVQSALYQKHCSSAPFSCLFPIDAILQDDLSPGSVHYHEMTYLAQDHECLKRVYSSWQYPSKIGQLTQYYKFSRELPKFHDPLLLRTMQRYYDKVRQLDFKKVKTAVKRQQGISLTSYHSDSSLPDSQEEQQKSKYSNVLQELNEDSRNESHLFNNFCQQIQAAFPEEDPQSAIKGYFPEQNVLKFKQFLEKAEKKSKGFCFKKQKQMNSTQKISNKENTLKNGLNLIRQPSKKSVLKSISQKTRANDTLSREQRSKRIEKQNLMRTIDCENIFRSTLTGFIKRQAPRTLEQIYKGNNQHQQSKYSSAKEKKMSVQGNKKKPSLFKDKSKSKIPCRPHLIQNNFVLDTERNKEQTRKSLTKISVHKSIEQIPKRQPSYKGLPSAQKQQIRERTLSRSKSKQKMSRQASRQSVKVKPCPAAHTNSRFNESLAQKEVRLREDKRIDRILSKKLALFKI